MTALVAVIVGAVVAVGAAWYGAGAVIVLGIHYPGVAAVAAAAAAVAIWATDQPSRPPRYQGKARL